MKIIVDGEFDISDETGQKVHAVKGDVFYCEWDVTIMFACVGWEYWSDVERSL